MTTRLKHQLWTGGLVAANLLVFCTSNRLNLPIQSLSPGARGRAAEVASMPDNKNALSITTTEKPASSNPKSSPPSVMTDWQSLAPDVEEIVYRYTRLIDPIDPASVEGELIIMGVPEAAEKTLSADILKAYTNLRAPYLASVESQGELKNGERRSIVPLRQDLINTVVNDLARTLSTAVAEPFASRILKRFRILAEDFEKTYDVSYEDGGITVHEHFQGTTTTSRLTTALSPKETYPLKREHFLSDYLKVVQPPAKLYPWDKLIFRPDPWSGK